MKIDRMKWRRDKEAVMEVEQAAFPSNMRSDEQDLEQYATAEGGIGLVARTGILNGINSGYAVAVPLETVSYAGCKEDPDRGKENSAYVESLAVKPAAKPAVLI